MTKTVDASSAAPGGTLVYVVTFRNLGPNGAAVVLTDPLPSSTLFSSLTIATTEVLSQSVPQVGQTGTVQVSGLVRPDAVAELRIAVRVDPATPPGTQISNIVTVSGTPDDPNPSNNTAAATSLVSPTQPVPTLSSAALVLFALALAFAAVISLHR